MSLPSGTRLGPYEIQSAIGAGGMGEVYKARDTRLDRPVAIKILPPEVSADPDRRARFEREAKTIAGLSHPHICSLHDVGEHDGSTYLVMEHLAGQTLAERLEKGALPLEQALTIATEIADALATAHRQGVIHRDLKPSNVMLAKTGAKLLDFGLAKLKGHGEQPAATQVASMPTRSVPLTAEGVIVGTLQYMAPEQVEGKPADARTDLWALGAILYEMVAGKRAFEGTSAASLIANIMNAEPPLLTALEPVTPPAVDRLVRQCLAKEPERRWQCAHDLATELKWIMEGGRDAGSDARRRLAHWKRTLAAVAGGLLAGAAITASVLWLSLGGLAGSSQRIVRATIRLPEGVNVNFDRRSPVAISPDGSRVAIAGIRGSTRQLYLREFDASDVKPIPGTEGADGPFFSPDNQWIGYFAGGELRKIPAGGGAPQAILKARDVRGAAWGRDGFIVLSPNMTVGLSKVAVVGGTAELLTVPAWEQREKSHRFPFIMPGGQAVLITISRNDVSSYDDARIGVLSLKTRRWKVLIEGGTGAKYSSTGHIIYGRGSALLAAPFDPARLEVTGPAALVIDNVAVSPEFGVAAFDVSADGTLVYAPRGLPGAMKRLYAVDRRGKTETLLETPSTLQNARVSPDGTRVALYLLGANDSAWVYDIGRKALTKAVLRLGDTQMPSWSQDGSRITYATVQPPGLAWMAADGSGQEDVLYVGENAPGHSEWSPDGRYLAFTESRSETANDIFVLSLKDGRECTPFLNTRYDERRPRFSPDGRWIAYTSNESGRYEVYVRPFPGPGGKWQVSTGGATMHNWSPDGRELFYREAGRVMAVAVEASAGRFRTSAPRSLFESSDGGPEDVMPDGRFLMIQNPPPDRPRELHLVLNWSAALRKQAAR